MFHLITIKREELYHLSKVVEELTDSKIVALSQELDLLITEYQNLINKQTYLKVTGWEFLLQIK